ncbi:MAG: hypothetical protein Q4F99_04765 [bacterium]|nr:hypothetical protein [bacterium]
MNVKTPQQENNFYLWSIMINIGLFLFLFVGTGISCVSSEDSKEEIIPMEFLVVTEENAADMLAEEPSDVVEEIPELPEPEPEPPAPEPPPLPDPPKIENPDPVPPLPPPPKEEVKEKPKEQPKEKPKDKPKETVKEKPKEKPTPKPIKIGKRVGPVTDGKKDKTKEATQKKLSEDEIAKLLAAGAKSGNKNQIPKNEASRVAGLIQKAFTQACNEAGIEPIGGHRAPILKVTFKKGRNPGAIASISLKQSSGNQTHDQRVLGACRGVRSIGGISETFLKSVNYAVEIRVFVD